MLVTGNLLKYHTQKREKSTREEKKNKNRNFNWKCNFKYSSATFTLLMCWWMGNCVWVWMFLQQSKIEIFFFFYLLTIKFVNFSLSTNVAVRNHALVNTIVKIVLLMTTLLIYSRRQYPLCAHIWKTTKKN